MSIHTDLIQAIQDERRALAFANEGIDLAFARIASDYVETFGTPMAWTDSDINTEYATIIYLVKNCDELEARIETLSGEVTHNDPTYDGDFYS